MVAASALSSPFTGHRLAGGLKSSNQQAYGSVAQRPIGCYSTYSNNIASFRRRRKVAVITSLAKSVRIFNKNVQVQDLPVLLKPHPIDTFWPESVSSPFLAETLTRVDEGEFALKIAEVLSAMNYASDLYDAPLLARKCICFLEKQFEKEESCEPDALFFHLLSGGLDNDAAAYRVHSAFDDYVEGKIKGLKQEMLDACSK